MTQFTWRNSPFDIWANVKLAEYLTFKVARFDRRDQRDSATGGIRTLDDLRCILMYACEYPTRRKRIPMNVEQMVDRWLPIVKGLATAHEKAAVDRCEYDSETHLAPLLTAPVKQIRQFVAMLVRRLKADQTVPFFVWAAFESWERVILKDAPDGDIVELKGVLAKEVAELIEKQVQPDLPAAIAGALQWRSKADLVQVRDAVQNGGRARLVGRESCLFVQVDDPDGKQVATVML